MNKLRRFLTIGVMAITVLATIGAYAPVNASASAGDLIKMDGLSSVYYLGSDGKRYVFPNTDTYMSWYNDFSGVVTIPASELQSYPLGGNVTMRPGTKLVKITTDPSVYAVEPNGVLRKIQSEAQASALYGSNWNKRVVDVADAFFTNYTISSALPSGSTPAGSLVKSASGATVYYYDGSSYRAIADESAFNANRFNFSNVITVASIATTGTAVSSAEFVNVAQNGATTGVVVTGSGLMVSLNSNTPAAASVPKNGSRIKMATVNLTAANDGSVTLNSLTVKRIGLSTYGDIDKVWAEKAGEIVASKKSMNSDNESILVFSPALVIPAGTTISVDLLAGLTGNDTGNIGLSIASASAVSATAASVTGSFPVNGNLMSPTTYTVAGIAITATSSVTASLKVGDENVELGSFTTELIATGSKDVIISSIMLKNNGVEDLSSLMNLYVEYAGDKVSTSYTVDGRYVTFNFANGLPLLKDDGSKILYIKGDVIAKENTGTGSFSLTLNKSTDLSAYEKVTGFGINVYKADGVSAADSLSIVTADITAGAITVSKKSTSPSDTSIIKGAEYTMLLANVKVDEAIVTDGINVVYDSVASSTQFENVKVYVNGLLLDSFDPSTAAGATEAIDSTVTFNKGDNEVKVVARAKTNAVVGSEIKFALDSTIFSSMNPEYVVSGNTVSGTVGGSATGGIFTVQGATLTTVKNDGYAASKTIVQGSSDVSLGKFVVKGENDTVRITSVTFSANNAASGTKVPSGSISDMKLYFDGVQVGNTTNFNGGVSFSSLNISIAKDSTKNIELKGSFDSSATSTFQTTMTINAQDSRGTAITSGNVATTTNFVMVGAGTLNVALGGDTPAAGVMATKAGVEQEVAQFKLTAIDDSASVTEINVINTPMASSTIVSTSTGVSTADSRIAAIKLYDGATLIDSFVPVSGAGKFTITNDKVKIEAGASKTLSIKVVLNNISNDAAATNKDLHLGITTMKVKSSAGSESTQTIATLANNFRLRKTVASVTLQALPSTSLTGGDAVVSKFKVSADSNGDVTLKQFVLNYTNTANATITPLTKGASVKVNGSYKTLSDVRASSTDQIVYTFVGDGEVIAAGGSKEFEVYATTEVSGQGSESIATKIVEDSAYLTGAAGADIDANFVWSDGASVSQVTYANGFHVGGLTTSTQVLSK